MLSNLTSLKSRLLDMAPFDKLHKSSYCHSTVTIVLSCIISEIKRDICENRNFSHTTHALDTSVRVVSVGILPRRLVWKTRLAGLPAGEKSSRICLLVSIQYRDVTDRQTDNRQTDTT